MYFGSKYSISSRDRLVNCYFCREIKIVLTITVLLFLQAYAFNSLQAGLCFTNIKPDWVLFSHRELDRRYFTMHGQEYYLIPITGSCFQEMSKHTPSVSNQSTHVTLLCLRLDAHVPYFVWFARSVLWDGSSERVTSVRTVCWREKQSTHYPKQAGLLASNAVFFPIGFSSIKVKEGCGWLFFFAQQGH